MFIQNGGPHASLVQRRMVELDSLLTFASLINVSSANLSIFPSMMKSPGKYKVSPLLLI
jgi:hypothetical protein